MRRLADADRREREAEATLLRAEKVAAAEANKARDADMSSRHPKTLGATTVGDSRTSVPKASSTLPSASDASKSEQAASETSPPTPKSVAAASRSATVTATTTSGIVDSNDTTAKASRKSGVSQSATAAADAGRSKDKGRPPNTPALSIDNRTADPSGPPTAMLPSPTVSEVSGEASDRGTEKHSRTGEKEAGNAAIAERDSKSGNRDTSKSGGSGGSGVSHSAAELGDDASAKRGKGVSLLGAEAGSVGAGAGGLSSTAAAMSASPARKKQKSSPAEKTGEPALPASSRPVGVGASEAPGGATTTVQGRERGGEHGVRGRGSSSAIPRPPPSSGSLSSPRAWQPSYSPRFAGNKAGLREAASTARHIQQRDLDSAKLIVRARKLDLAAREWVGLRGLLLSRATSRAAAGASAAASAAVGEGLGGKGESVATSGSGEWSMTVGVVVVCV